MRKVVAAAVVMAVGAVVVIAAFLWERTNYTAESHYDEMMEPTISEGDTLVVREVSGDEVHRGDIVVFSTEAWGFAGLAVKRVAGIGGDSVVCCDPERRLKVNDKAVTEEYLRPPADRADLAANLDYTVSVPPSHVWLLNDWRDSMWRDSRTEMNSSGPGVIPAADIRGVVVSAEGEDLTTKAFTDAGLPGATYQDSLRGTLRIVMAGGGVLFFGGIVWLVVALRRRDKLEV